MSKLNFIAKLVQYIVSIIMGIFIIIIIHVLEIFSQRGWLLWQLWALLLILSGLILYEAIYVLKRKLYKEIVLMIISMVIFASVGNICKDGKVAQAKIRACELSTETIIYNKFMGKSNIVLDDPFNNNGKLHIKYLADNMFIVWSIGPDGIDDKGEIQCNKSIKYVNDGCINGIFKIFRSQYWSKSYPGDIVWKIKIDSEKAQVFSIFDEKPKILYKNDIE